MDSPFNKFSLQDRVAIITGGSGLMGIQHGEVIAQAGGIPVLWDINKTTVHEQAKKIGQRCNTLCLGMEVDITQNTSIKAGLDKILNEVGRPHILINNAANDPKVSQNNEPGWDRLENFPLETWRKDLEVGLLGAFLCSQLIGSHMANHGGGVILNIASDLGVIAPDQRIYNIPNISQDKQPVKPVTYSVIKHGIIGLTKYLATYWANSGVRANAISPGGIYTDQSPEFVTKLTQLIPLGRMAQIGEYNAAILFLVSDASSYMTGSNLIIDGGRTCW